MTQMSIPDEAMNYRTKYPANLTPQQGPNNFNYAMNQQNDSNGEDLNQMLNFMYNKNNNDYYQDLNKKQPRK